MSRIEKSTLSNVRHDYRIPYPTTIEDSQLLAEQTSKDMAEAGVTSEVQVWGDESGLNASWMQDVELDPSQAIYGGAQSEVLARALMSEAGHTWDSTNETGREHYRQKAKAVMGDMLASK